MTGQGTNKHRNSDQSGRFATGRIGFCALLVAWLLAFPFESKADGIPDPTFDSDGRMLFDVHEEKRERIGDITIDSQGRTLLVGAFSEPLSQTFVARLTADGKLDTNFAGTGVQLLGAANNLNAVEVDSAGRIVAAGSFGNVLSIVRLLTNGDLDPGFGTAGAVYFDTGANTQANWDLAIDPDDNILTVGDANALGTINDLTLIKVRPDGTPDTSLGGTGLIKVLPGWYSGGRAIELDSQGRVVLAGYLRNETSAENDFLALRLTPQGILDMSFNGSGRQTVNFGVGANEIAWSLTLDQAGQLTLVGTPDNSAENRTVVAARLRPEGNLDTSFGSDGRVRLVNSDGSYFAYDHAIDRAGRTVIAGSQTPQVGNGRASLQRLLPNGALDTTFGQAGTLREDYLAGTTTANAVAIDPQGSYVIAGTANLGGDDNRIGVARYNVSYPLARPTLKIRKIVRNKKKGIARVTLLASRAGKLKVAGKGIRTVNKRMRANKRLAVQIRTRPKKTRALRRKGRFAVKVRFNLRTNDGQTRVVNRRIVLLHKK